MKFTVTVFSIVFSLFFVSIVHSQTIEMNSGDSTALTISKTLSTVIVFPEEIEKHAAERVDAAQFFNSGDSKTYNTVIISPLGSEGGALFVRTISGKDYHFVLLSNDVPSKVVYVNPSQKKAVVETDQWIKSVPYESVVLNLISNLIEPDNKIKTSGYKLAEIDIPVEFVFDPDIDIADKYKKKKVIKGKAVKELKGAKISAYKIVIENKKNKLVLSDDMFNKKGVIGVSVIGNEDVNIEVYIVAYNDSIDFITSSDFEK